MSNKLRELVKTDRRTIGAIAAETGLHPNTIQKLIAYEYLTGLEHRPVKSIETLAALYGYKVRVRIEFVETDKADV